MKSFNFLEYLQLSGRSLIDSMLAYYWWGQGSNPRADISKKTKYEEKNKNFPSDRFHAKPVRDNKIPFESFSKNLHSEWTLNCRSNHTCTKINTHNINDVRNLGIIFGSAFRSLLFIPGAYNEFECGVISQVVVLKSS